MQLLKEIMDSNTDAQEIFNITAQPVPEFKLIKSTSLDLTHSLSGTVEKYLPALENCLGGWSTTLSEYLLAYAFLHSVLFISKDLSQIKKTHIA